MSYENWWEGTDEDFKRSLIDKELIKDKDLQENPIATTEGWGVFLARALSKVGIGSLENKLSKKSTDKIASVFKEPRVAQWIDIQAKLILKQASPYAKKFVGPDINLTFATEKDVAKYINNPYNGIIDYDGTAKVTTDLDFKKYFIFIIRCGKYILQVAADSTSIKRVFLLLKSSENSLCFATVKAPADQELLKIVGAIESCEIVEEGLISKIKSFIGSKEIKKVRPKRDPKATLSAAKAAIEKALTMDEFKVLKPYIGFDSHVDLNEFGKYGVVFARLEFKFNLPNVDRDFEEQEDVFWPIWNKFMEKVNELLDDPAYEIFTEGKAKDAVIELDYNDKVAITDEAAELLDFSYGVEQVSESLFTLDNLDDSTKMMLFGTAAFGVVSAGVGFLKHIGYELGDTVGKGIRNKLNNREYKKFIRAVNDPEVQRFLKEQCNEVFEEAKKKFPNVTKKVSAVDGKAVETGAKKVKTSKGIIGRFFSSPNIIPIKAGEYLVILDGTPSEGVKTAVVVLQDADTKKYICSLLTPPTLMAEAYEPIDEGWIDFTAQVIAGFSQGLISYPMKRLANKAVTNIGKVFSIPEVVKWVDEQFKNALVDAKKQMQSRYSEKFKISEFKSNLDHENYEAKYDSYGVFNAPEELGTLKQYKAIGTFYTVSGKHLLLVVGSHDTIYRVLIPLKIECTSNKDLNGYCLYKLDPPEDLNLKKVVGSIESYEPTTEGFGMSLARKVTAGGWATAIVAALASISTFGAALFCKGTWAALIGGAAVGNVAGAISRKLCDKANKYIETALSNPEMAAYIRAKAKEVVNDIKKQASSMKDGKYVINTNIQPDDLPSDIFHQTFKAPGEETDERIEKAKDPMTPFSGYEYAEKKVGEYTIAVFYDTNSIKGLYVVVEIKDLADKFGSSWIRVRPIPAPSKEDLKKMNLK